MRAKRRLEDKRDKNSRIWLRTGETITEVVRWMGVEPPPLSLDCRPADQKVQFKLYDREKLTADLLALGGKSR